MHFVINIEKNARKGGKVYDQKLIHDRPVLSTGKAWCQKIVIWNKLLAYYEILRYIHIYG